MTFTPVAAADGILQRRGHERLDDRDAIRALGRDETALLELGEAVVGEQGADLVAGEQMQFAVGAAHGTAHAVGVGIGRHHDIESFLLREGHGEGERLGVSGLGDFTVGNLASNADCAATSRTVHPARCSSGTLETPPVP